MIDFEIKYHDAMLLTDHKRRGFVVVEEGGDFTVSNFIRGIEYLKKREKIKKEK